MSSFLKFLLQACLPVLCLLCSSGSTYAKELGEDEQYPYSHVISVSSLLPSTVCNRSSKVSRKGSLELVHKYGPCSELKQGKANIPSWSEILHKDQARVHAINSKRRQYMNSNENQLKQTESVTFPFGNDMATAGGEMYAKVDIGTPAQSNYVILDTGSDMTWIQCKPCVKCFKQHSPIFDPYKSSTHRIIPCKSSKCNLLAASNTPHNRSCISNACIYGASYGDESYSFGYLAQDKLTFPSTDRKSKEVIENFLFGCGSNNNQTMTEYSIGMMGLGRTPISFVSQTASLFKKYFAYCIPSDYSSTGYLTFGKPDEINNKFIKFTPIPTTPQQSQYYDVIITGISVAGKMLPIKSSVFTKGGAIIDSGTTFTSLQPEAYAALRTAFRKEMAHYKRAAPDDINDTCYDFSSNEIIVVPKISFFFKGGVELEVNVKGMLYPDDKKGKHVCLAFTAAGDGEGAILGNIMQRSVEVVHDVEGRRVGFGPGTCA